MATSKRSNPKVFIVILNWNGKEDTLDCLSSVQKIDYPHFETVVVDNGSSDDSVSAIKALYPHVTLIETKENLGFAGGNNVGIRYCLDQGADAVCLLNNDATVDPKLLSAFVKKSQENPKLGIVGGKILLHSDPSKLDHLGGIWNPNKGSFDLIGNRAADIEFHWDDKKPLDYVCGAVFYVKKEVFASIGLLEEKFFLIWEESDFCFRAKRAGYAIGYCPDAKIFHKVSASMQGKAHSTYFWWRNRLFWIERNCTDLEKKVLYKKVLTPEILHLWKIKTIKSLELFFVKWLCSKAKYELKAERLKKTKAAWQGVQDYLHKRYGQAPAWIYKK